MNPPYHPSDMSQRQQHQQEHHQVHMANGSAGYPSAMPPLHSYTPLHQQQPPPQRPLGQPPYSHQHQHPHPPPPHPHHQHQPLQQQQPVSQMPSAQHLQHHPLHPPPHQSQPPLPPLAHQAPSHDDPPSAISQISSSQIIDQYPDQSMPISRVEEVSGWKYSLEVAQQPQRARMCGFGDKDRRPITPPPCVRLVIVDTNTGKEVDYNEMDFSLYVLQVDLWNSDGTQDVNLVRSSTGTPVPHSFEAVRVADDRNRGAGVSSGAYHQPVAPPSRGSSYAPSPAMGYAQEYPASQTYSQVTPSYNPPNGSYGPPQQYFPQHGGYRGDAGVPSFRGAPPQAGYGQDQNALARTAVIGGQPQGMFTRNLIGSLAASAFRLNDTDDRVGIWFVLQDLSVRTEGPFRLRFTFINVGMPGAQTRYLHEQKINRGKIPILASCFSNTFNVFSAKKFPGVCESTPLSKTFAAQGIKIPIRKDANSKGGDGDDSE